MVFLVRKLAAAMALAAVALPSSAVTYSTTFQNVTFQISPVDADTFTLSIIGADSANGDWTGIGYIKAFAVKDIGSGLTGASVTSGPGFGSWASSTSELNAHGCSGGPSGGVCLAATPAVALSSTMTWTVDVVGAPLAFAPTGPHLKVDFFKSPTQDKATGSLLSTSLVPEPETYALMLAGLAAVGFVARRRRDA